MYTSFYKFNEKPFHLVPNPAYLFMSEKHSNALTFLEYGLAEKVGFVMLTGEIGIGKTTLIRHLLNQVEQDMDIAVIFNTNVLSKDLIKLILIEFEIKFEESISKGGALALLYDFLIERYSKGRKVLLIIDEAQNLSDDVLEEIRMLSNLQTDDELLLQIMIVGQPQLRDKISDPRLEQFAQRIAVSYHLSALTFEETGEYIGYRIQKAGGDDKLFSFEAVEKIFEVSKGIPRTINLLCDAALVYGYADEKMQIDSDIIDQVIEDKGGIGVFTQDKLKTIRPDAESIDELKKINEELTRRVVDLEDSFSKLKEIYHNYIGELESRAEFCRDKMVSQIKDALEEERRQNKQLLTEHSRLKERYRLLINRFKKN